MANHGYVYTKKELTYDEVLNELESINQNLLGGLFKIEINDSRDLICITCEKYFGDHITLQIWISNETEYGYFEIPGDNSTYIKYDEPKIICKKSVIEFRHGYGTTIGWTIEGVFRENIAKKYDALIGDDGYDERLKPNPEKYLDIKKDIELRPSWTWEKDSKHFRDNITIEQIIDRLIEEIKQINRTRKISRIV